MQGDRSKEALQVSKLCKNSLDTLPTEGNKKSTLESSNQGHKSQQFHPDQGHAFPTLTRDYLRIQQTKPKGPSRQPSHWSRTRCSSYHSRTIKDLADQAGRPRRSSPWSRTCYSDPYLGLAIDLMVKSKDPNDHRLNQEHAVSVLNLDHSRFGESNSKTPNNLPYDGKHVDLALA